MQEYINSKMDILLAENYFFEHYMADEFDPRPYRKVPVKKFADKGFFTSAFWGEYYERLNGIHSDEYVPQDIYYYYIIPALNRMDFAMAYVDKNQFSRLFLGTEQPRTIVRNINGTFYDADYKALTEVEAAEIVSSTMCDMIIKPTVETHCGEGVCSIRNMSQKATRQLFFEYGHNFIVQEKVSQHPVMARFNETSVNTLRIYTYRDIRKRCVLLKSFLRFGSKGAIKDNASTGGGYTSIDENGVTGGTIYRYKTMSFECTEDVKGFEKLEVPSYGSAVKLCLLLQEKLPYFDLIGWDIAIREDETPVLIEYNLESAIEFAQIGAGPLFGSYFDEVMYRASKVRKEKGTYFRYDFPTGSRYFLHFSKG